MTRARKTRELALGLLTENFGFKALALVVALGIWGWVQISLVVEKRSRANVTYELPRNLVPSENLPSSVVLMVQGPQGMIRNLENNEVALRVDFSTHQAGGAAIDFSDAKVTGLPPGLTVQHISPPGVTFQLEKEVFRELPLRPAVVGTPAHGWVVDKVEVEPPTVTVRGPESVVGSLTEVSTDLIDMAEIKETKTYTTAPAIKERSVRLPETVVQVRVAVAPAQGERIFEAVPVRLSESDWKADPATVAVSVHGPVLGLDALTVNDLDLRLDFAKSGKAVTTLVFNARKGPSFDVHLPDESLEVLTVTPRRITVERP